MPAKDTNELVHELKNTRSMAAFLRENQGEMVSRSLPEYLAHLLEKKGLSQKDVIKASGLSASYACHIFSGERSTTRPKMLAIALAMKLTVEETQYLLHYAGLPQLYARVPWDSIIIHALSHQKSVIDTNLLLDDFGERPLLG